MEGLGFGAKRILPTFSWHSLFVGLCVQNISGCQNRSVWSQCLVQCCDEWEPSSSEMLVGSYRRARCVFFVFFPNNFWEAKFSTKSRQGGFNGWILLKPFKLVGKHIKHQILRKRLGKIPRNALKSPGLKHLHFFQTLVWMIFFPSGFPRSIRYLSGGGGDFFQLNFTGKTFNWKSDPTGD